MATCTGCGGALVSAHGRCAECLATLALPVGTELAGGALRIEGVSGWGDSGITYRAIQPALGRAVAVKELFPRDARRLPGGDVEPTAHHGPFQPERGQEIFERERAHFVEEARALVSLLHPRVVAVYDAFVEHGTAYQVLEWLDGISLDQRLGQGPLSEIEAAALGADLSQALAVLHAVGRIHGDIRPAHIFLDVTRGPILIDFGAAVRGGMDDAMASRPFRPPATMSMEVAAADVYGLVATLGFAVTGRTPEAGRWPDDRALRSSFVRAMEKAIGACQAGAIPALAALQTGCEAVARPVAPGKAWLDDALRRLPKTEAWEPILRTAEAIIAPSSLAGKLIVGCGFICTGLVGWANSPDYRPYLEFNYWISVGLMLRGFHLLAQTVEVDNTERDKP